MTLDPRKDKTVMATQTQQLTPTESERVGHGKEKIQQLRELFADAPELGRKALDKVLHELTAQASQTPPLPVESAGRAGVRLGKVSELTIVVPIAPGGAKRLRAFLQMIGGNLGSGASKVGTLHDMRFVFLDNDTRMLFAAAYDGDWDAYIDDFATKIPDYLDIIDSAWEGWPGIRSPHAKDSREIPGRGGRLVRRRAGFDCGGDATAEAQRKGPRRVPGQDRRVGGHHV
jgi:hypothetical protein